MTCMINTVLGPISSDQLGCTDMHEHFILGMPGSEYDASYTFDEAAIKEQCESQIREAQSYGLKSVIDATPMDLGRKPLVYKAMAEDTGVNIICSTGLYTEAEGNNAFWRLLAMYKGYDEALRRLSASYIRDLTVGMCGTDIKCGVIKVATGKGQITKIEEISIHAAALAQKETGAPIISHTAEGCMGTPTAKMMLEKGCDPKKTMVGHLCDTNDLDNDVIPALEMGFYVGLERFGLSMIFSDEDKCKNLVELVNRGYGDKILIGDDATIHNIAGDLIPDDVLATMPDWNMVGIHKTFIPKMKELGLTDDQVKTIMVDNPRRFFEGA